jgi:hypothetical protein
MAEFLDDDVRRVIQARWDEHVANDGVRPKRNLQPRNLPSKSRYFLSKLIRIKGTERTMVGTDGSTRGDEVHRYYLSRRCSDAPVAGAPAERLRAEVVEEKVKEALRAALQDFDVNEPRVAGFIEARKRELRGKTDGTFSLREEKAELEDWYKRTYSVAGVRGQTVLGHEAKRVEKRLEQIDLQLLEAGAVQPDVLNCTPAEIIASIRRQFTELKSVVDGRCFESLRGLAASLCSQLTFDPVTRVVEIEIALPSWALSKQDRLLDAVGTEEISRPTNFPCTDNEKLVLEGVSCDLIGRRMPCMECRRVNREAA